MEHNFLLTAPVWKTIHNNIVASKSEHDWPTLTLLHFCLLGVIQWSQYLNTEDPNVSISTNIPEIIEKITVIYNLVCYSFFRDRVPCGCSRKYTSIKQNTDLTRSTTAGKTLPSKGFNDCHNGFTSVINFRTFLSYYLQNNNDK